MRISDLPKPDHIGAVVELLQSGQRCAAAEHARLRADSAKPSELRELVRVLADALREAGDVRKGKRGRPLRVYDGTPEGLSAFIRRSKVNNARRQWEDAIVACDLRDDKRVEALRLAEYAVRGCRVNLENGPATLLNRVEAMAAAISAEPVEAAAYLLPYARETLRSLGLLTAKRQGFRAHAMRKIAQRYNVTVDQIRKAK